MSLVECITKKRRLDTEDVLYIVRETNNQKDYLFMNYLEQEIIKQYGKQFIMESANKIQYIIGFLLKEDIDGLEVMYNGCFDQYMSMTNESPERIDGFNIVFIVLIHMAYKIIRKYKTEASEPSETEE